MGFWNFFKKKEPIEAERIKFSELQPWLKNKKTEIKEQEDNFLKTIQTRISQLIQELEEKTLALKKININEKKAEDKIKLIVKENLDNYIYYLNKLLGKLKEINEKSEQTIEKINSVFAEFEKKSSISFEKATFLIGKELGNTKESIRAFFKALEKILKDNKELIEKSKIISLVGEKMEKFSEVEKTKSNIEQVVGEYNEKILNLNNSIKLQKKEIEKIQSSEKFLAENKKKQILIEKKQEIDKDTERLREMLDFKALANFFHSFEKEMSIIKAYKGNFKQTFQKTKGEDILSLLKESKLQNPEILNKIQDITKNEKEINSIAIEETGIAELENMIKKIKLELNILNSKKLLEEKKAVKIKGNLNEIISSIKGDLIKINVEVD